MLDFRTITAYGCNFKEAIHQGADPARRCFKFITTSALAATKVKSATQFMEAYHEIFFFFYLVFFCSSFFSLCTTTIDWKYPVQHTYVFRYKVPEYRWARISIRWLILPIVLTRAPCLYLYMNSAQISKSISIYRKHVQKLDKSNRWNVNV